MQFSASTLTTLVAFFAVTSAAPVAQTATDLGTPTAIYNGVTIYGNWTLSPIVGLNPRDSVNDCGDSSFTDETSSGSPSITDCQVIQKNIAGGGTWTLSGGAQRALASYGTCVFGATPGGGLVVYVGNQDIIDLITSSIQMFPWNGLVGAKGDMLCDTKVNYPSGTFSDTSWGLYHT